MRIEVVPDETALARRAADAVCDVVRAKPAAVLGLPTGNTPVLAYAELRRRAQDGALDMSGVTAFAVDEFADAPHGAPGTNAAWFTSHLRVPLRALRVPDSASADPDAEIARFALELQAARGLDLCLLGIGRNGHIAFNEPGSARDSRARVVTLDAATREAHAEAFGGLDRVPRRGMTLGVAEIMAARRVLVLAHGAHKAAIVRAAIEASPSADVPASWLQTHPDVAWLLDEPAASLLEATGRG